LHAINYESPKTVDEAVKLLAAHGEKARPLCGGTDLIIQLRAGVRRPEYVVDVKNIQEMRRIEFSMQHGLRLGAAVPCSEIYENGDMRKYYPGLTEAAHLIGSLQIQSRASVGGNLCNGSPAADTTPALIALGAKCRVVGPGGAIGRVCVATAAVAVIAGYGFFQVRGYVRGDATAAQRGISAAMAGVVPWVRETPPRAVIASEDEALVWLYGGRRAVPNYVWRHRGRGGESLGPDSLRAWFDRAGVTHVVVSGPGSDAAPTLNQLVDRNPGYLRLVRVLPGGALAFAVQRATAAAPPVRKDESR
jgi:hypothetical protein